MGIYYKVYFYCKYMTPLFIREEEEFDFTLKTTFQKLYKNQ